MTPFLMGGKQKSDPHGARLTAMAARIDALRDNITSDKARNEQLVLLQQTVNRLTAQVDAAKWKQEQAEKKAEAISKPLNDEIATLKTVVATFETEGAELSIINAQQAAHIEQLESDNSQLLVEAKAFHKRRWWQWR